MASARMRGASHFLPGSSLLAWCVLFAVTEASAQDTEVRTALRASLPGYDPSVHQKSPADQPKTAPKPEESPAALAGPQPAPAPTGGVGQEPVRLAPFTVYANRLKPATPSPVPRPAIEPPENDIAIDPFLAPKGRDALLTKKYLTGLDRCLLNRWSIPLVGQTKEARARKADKAHQAAVAQGELADAVDALGKVDPESKEYQELKEIYRQIEYSRPRD